MPSFALRRFNRSSPSQPPSLPIDRARVVCVSALTRSRAERLAALDLLAPNPAMVDHPVSARDNAYHRQPPTDQVLMARLQALNLCSMGHTPSASAPASPSLLPKSTSPLSHRSVSTGRVSPSFSSGSDASHHSASQNERRAVTDLPPLSPLSSMYDPHSVVGSGSSEDGRSSPSHTLSSSDSEARTPPISIVPVCEHTLRCSDVRGPVVNGGGFARSQQSNNAPQNHFSSRSRSAQTINPRTAIDGRPSAFAGVAARGKVLDDFVPSRSIKEQPQGMPRNPSIKNLEIPRGKHEQLPLSRPDTPSRLPRHRVFIKQSTSRTSVVDAVAVTQDAEDENEAVFVTREVPVNSVDNGCRLRDASDLPNMQSLRDEEFYFSDEGEIEEEPVDFKRDPYTPVNASDVLSSRVRRAVSALRSISFQSNQFEDLDTAWGQAGAVEFAKDRKTRLPESTCGSRWRRPRGRISSKNGVQEFGCYSENDARSTRSYGSNMSVRDRAFGGRDQVRGAPGMKDRGNYVSHHKRSLWSGGRRDRNPQARAAQLLVNYGGQGLLAASSEPRDLDNALTTVSQADALDMTGRSPNRRSVDKYVEFIHASAQRETRNKLSHKSFSSRVISKVFRRRWN